MKGLSAQNNVALALHYDSREEMVEKTGVDPETIDDDDESTWPDPKIKRTITVECLAGGGFTIREGNRFCDRLCWDEMLGHLASMTIPPGGRMYPMLTKAEEIAAIKERHRRREEREKENQSKTTPPA